MRVSIAIATYNGELFIEEQLKSIASQTRLPDEVIVCDDCSSDCTLAVINDFAASSIFPIQVYVNDTNLGYGQNFSNAISKTTGDYVFLSDQDDVWFPTKISTMLSYFEQSPEYLCIMCDSVLTDVSLRPIGATKRQQLKKAGQPDTAFIMGCCAGFLGSFARSALPLPSSLSAHDTWLIGLSDLYSMTQRLDLPLQYYRRHPNATSQILVNSSYNHSSFSFFLKNTILKVLNIFSSDRLIRDYELALAQLSWCMNYPISSHLSLRDTSSIIKILQVRIFSFESRIALRTLPRLNRIRCLPLYLHHHSLSFASILKDLITTKINHSFSFKYFSGCFNVH